MTELLHFTVQRHTAIQSCDAQSWEDPNSSIVHMLYSASSPEDALQALPIISCQHNLQHNINGHAAVTHSQVQQLSLYSSLLQQLDALGWSKVVDVSKDFDNITLRLADAAQRLHTVHLELPNAFPAAAPVVSISLPRPFRTKWLPGHTLTQLVMQIEQVLDTFQPLWEQLEDLDYHTQVLDPQQALAQPYSNCSRCIALGNGASCQLQLSVAAPRSLPAVTFHGPSSVVAGLQSSWYGNAHTMWDDTCAVRQNLQAVLQLQIPAPRPGSRKGCAAAREGYNPGQLQDPDVSMEDAVDGGNYNSDLESDDDADVGACAICYSLYLPDPDKPEDLSAAADVECSSCKRLFHAKCLAEWLGALPDSRRVFDTLFGTCPFCQSSIGVSTRTVRS